MFKNHLFAALIQICQIRVYIYTVGQMASCLSILDNRDFVSVPQIGRSNRDKLWIIFYQSYICFSIKTYAVTLRLGNKKKCLGIILTIAPYLEL